MSSPVWSNALCHVWEMLSNRHEMRESMSHRKKGILNTHQHITNRAQTMGHAGFLQRLLMPEDISFAYLVDLRVARLMADLVRGARRLEGYGTYSKHDGRAESTLHHETAYKAGNTEAQQTATPICWPESDEQKQSHSRSLNLGTCI